MGAFDLFRAEYWPLIVGLSVLATAALLFVLLNRVPNGFTFCAAAAGWATALAAPSLCGPPLAGDIVCSVTGSVIGGLGLGKMYRLGLGAGCVKAQIAYGAWVGCALPLETTVIATFATTLWAGAFFVIATIVWGRLCGRPAEELHFEDCPEVPDCEMGPPTSHLPPQVLLSLGTILGVLLLFWIDAGGQRPYLPHNRNRAAIQANQGGN